MSWDGSMTGTTSPRRHLELGLDTFGDITLDAEGTPGHAAHVIRDVVEQAVLADRLGLVYFGVGGTQLG